MTNYVQKEEIYLGTIYNSQKASSTECNVLNIPPQTNVNSAVGNEFVKREVFKVFVLNQSLSTM